MKNCYLTQLKGNVDNSNIPFYGSRKFEVISESAEDFKVRVSKDAVLSVASGTFSVYDNAGTTMIVSGVSSYTFTNVSNTTYKIVGKGVFFLENKYEQYTGIRCDNIPSVMYLDTFNYCKNLSDNYTGTGCVLKGTLKIKTMEAVDSLNIANISDESTGVIDFEGASTSAFNYFAITNNPKGCVKNLDIVILGNTSPYIDNSANINVVYLEGCSTVYGEVTDFADAIKSKNTRKQGGVSLRLKGTACTWNGSPITDSIIKVRFDSSGDYTITT